MTRYATMNPLGSSSPYDLFDNSQNFDTALNSITAAIWQDRLGKNRHTWYGLEKMASAAIAAFGYITMDSFQAGATLTLLNQVLRDTSTGEYYRWDGSFLPSGKVVPPGSTPVSSGGIGIGAWLSVGDAVLRSNLLSEADHLGDALLTVKQKFAGAVKRTQDEFNAQFPSVEDAGALGDGVTPDTAAFNLYETAFTGRDVDLHGKTYVVSAIPAGNRYFNGKFLVGTNTYDANRVLAKDSNGVISLGDGAAGSFPADYVMPPTAWGRTAVSVATIAFGQGALAKAIKAKQTTAIGPDAMGNTRISFDNNAWGECALQNVQSESDEYGFSLPGTRNIGIGGNAGQFLTTGDQNIFIGRNNGCCSVTVSGTTSVGPNALGGQAYGGWYSDEIINFLPNYNTTTEISVFGNKVGQYFTGTTLTAVGFLSGANLKTGDSNVLMGNGAGRDLEIDVGWQGKVLTTYDHTNYVTYVKTGSNVVVTAPGSGAVVGGRAHIYWSSGPASPGHGHPFPVEVTAVSGDTFTIQCPLTGDGTGNARLHWTTSTVDAPKSRHNFMAGCNSGMSTKTATNSVFIGSLVGQFVQSVTTTVAIGYGALQNNTSPNLNSIVSIGTNSLRDNTGNCGAVTAVGHNAGLLMQDGSVPTISIAGSVILGANARVSGPNQVQLGGSGTTPYAFAALQIRSDKRDKADEREIDGDLAVAFVRGLKSYFYKLDLRDDYIETYEVQVGIDKDAQPVFETRSRILPKDGSKKRVRDHAGYFTQQVKALMDELGIDFGMYQDHRVNGGCDVQSLGYEQAIPLISKALAVTIEKGIERDKRQDAQDKRMNDLEERLAKLEKVLPENYN
ncbi:hypothetical protein [Citrobacter freundii]|uniref:tail fiber/spike domain-containing protein n=1 Tax=Citrobacter freundii TaxID=546 RepID=UPI00200E0829|nr:hypothetical protein [Citrobacter freundii]UQI38072.1 hypothetical protein M3L74_10025 [Citrobacter freundii]